VDPTLALVVKRIIAVVGVRLGLAGGHTLCAMVNDLCVCERLARPQLGHGWTVTCGNALPLFTGVKWAHAVECRSDVGDEAF
jgi:hypothetical protein